jgi:hypothetical protein
VAEPARRFPHPGRSCRDTGLLKIFAVSLKFLTSKAEKASTMKRLFLFLSLFLSLSTLPAQQDARQLPEKQIADAALPVVFENVVRTAYMAVHGSVDGFDPSLVSMVAPVVNDTTQPGDISPWVVYSNTFRSRLGALRLMEAKGRIYHVWPDLLGNKRVAKQILMAHYGG